MKLLSTTPHSGDAFPQGVAKLTYKSSFDGLQDWALVLPGTNPELFIVNLHGHGAHGDQLYMRQDIRNCWLDPFMKAGAGVLTPNLRDNAWMNPGAASDMHELLDYCRRAYGMQKTLFFSGSMGATGSLIYSVLFPDDVDAVVALGAATDIGSYYQWCLSQKNSTVQEIAAAIRSGYSEVDLARHSVVDHAEELTMPLYFIHGQDDAIIPIEQARLLADKLAGKASFTYREIEGGGHDAPLFEIDCLSKAMEHLQ